MFVRGYELGVMDFDSDLSDEHFQRGLSAAESGDVGYSIGQFRAAISFNEGNWDAHFNLALACGIAADDLVLAPDLSEKRSLNEEGVRHIRRYLKRHPYSDGMALNDDLDEQRMRIEMDGK